MDKLLYRPKEAAAVLGIGRSKVYDLMRSGRLDSRKDGGARLITADSLRAYVDLLFADTEEAAL
jgi:excisionase family DNA binding protein